MAGSLRTAFDFLAMPAQSAFPSSLPGVRPSSMLEFILACRDPRLAQWTNPARDPVEDTSFSEEAQGIGMDGAYWYVSNNANDGREALRKLDLDFRLGVVRNRIDSPFAPPDAHVGALGVRDGFVYVALQRHDGDGVWKVSTDFTTSVFLQPESLPEDGQEDLFAWCDFNPHNGYLYTCDFLMPAWLRAFKDTGESLVWVQDADIPIVQPTEGPPTRRVQDGCFTPRYKWLALCDDSGIEADAPKINPLTGEGLYYERIHCHSTLTGAFLGRRSLPANTDESGSVLAAFHVQDVVDEYSPPRNELEGICLGVADGVPGQIHVLELNNEELSADDVYLWHLASPDPDTM
jgi:hypothetical protein